MHLTKLARGETSTILYRMSFIALSVVGLTAIIGALGFGWYQNPSSVETVGDSTIYTNYAGVGAEQARIAQTSHHDHNNPRELASKVMATYHDRRIAILHD